MESIKEMSNSPNGDSIKELNKMRKGEKSVSEK
jgi:hypothetical protein